MPQNYEPEANHSSNVQPRCRRFLTPEEAAEFMGSLNSRTVTRWAREGYLPAIPVGEGKRRLWRFREADLEGWMLSRRTGLTTSAYQATNGKLVSAADALTGGYIQ